MSVVDSNPCPKCGNRCHHMAGINVPGKAKTTERYLVCWECRMSKEIGADTDWRQFKQKAAPRDIWKKHTAFHWSREIDGKRLDYWPSKRKWQFEGRISRGDINGFLRRHKAD